MNKQKEQFFFAKQAAEADIIHRLMKEKGHFRGKVNELQLNEFHSLCEHCLPLADAELYSDFLTYEQVVDLQDFTKRVLEQKQYTLKAYKKTLVEMLILHHLENTIVWFYFNKKELL